MVISEERTEFFMASYQWSSLRKEKNRKPPMGENVVTREQKIRVNLKGGKQGGTPKKESPRIANPKGDPSRCQWNYFQGARGKIPTKIRAGAKRKQFRGTSESVEKSPRRNLRVFSLPSKIRAGAKRR